MSDAAACFCEGFGRKPASSQDVMFTFDGSALQVVSRAPSTTVLRDLILRVSHRIPLPPLVMMFASCNHRRLDYGRTLPEQGVRQHAGVVVSLRMCPHAPALVWRAVSSKETAALVLMQLLRAVTGARGEALRAVIITSALGVCEHHLSRVRAPAALRPPVFEDVCGALEVASHAVSVGILLQHHVDSLLLHLVLDQAKHQLVRSGSGRNAETPVLVAALQRCMAAPRSYCSSAALSNSHLDILTAEALNAACAALARCDADRCMGPSACLDISGGVMRTAWRVFALYYAAVRVPGGPPARIVSATHVVCNAMVRLLQQLSRSRMWWLLDTAALHTTGDGWRAAPGAQVVPGAQFVAEARGAPEALAHSVPPSASVSASASASASVSVSASDATERYAPVHPLSEAYGIRGGAAAPLQGMFPHAPVLTGASEDEDGDALEPLTLLIDRENLLTSTMSQVMGITDDELLSDRLCFDIVFVGESGYGLGVAREWVATVCLELFDPRVGLFVQAPSGASGARVMHPNPSGAELFTPEYREQWMRFTGRMLGLAVRLNVHTGVHLTRACWNMMLHKRGLPALEELDELHPQVAQSCRILLAATDESQVAALMLPGFVASTFGRQEVELLPGGANMDVTLANRELFVTLLVAHMNGAPLYRAAHCVDGSLQAEQIRSGGKEDALSWAAHSARALLCGMADVACSGDANTRVPPLQLAAALAGMPTHLLNHLVGGAVSVTADQLRDATHVQACPGVQAEVRDATVLCFWQAVQQMQDDERRALLVFWTGSSSLPAEAAWSQLRRDAPPAAEGGGGTRPPLPPPLPPIARVLELVVLKRPPGEQACARLPTSHMCYQQLAIPEPPTHRGRKRGPGYYTVKDMLKLLRQACSLGRTIEDD